jgi:hypothetical protein
MLTPIPAYAEIYRDEVIAAVTGYYDARNDHDQAALDRAMTARSPTRSNESRVEPDSSMHAYMI